MLVLVATLGLHLIVEKGYYGRITKLQARDAVSAVITHEDPDEVAVLSVGISPAYVQYQFRQQDDRFGVDIGDRKAKVAEIPGLLRRLLRKSPNRAWVLCLQRPPHPMLVAGTYAALDIDHVEGLYFAAAWGGELNATRLKEWLAGDLELYRRIKRLRPADGARPLDPLRVPSFLPGNPGPMPVYLARGRSGGAQARISLGRQPQSTSPRFVFYAMCHADEESPLVIRVGARSEPAASLQLPRCSWRWVFAVFDREEVTRRGASEIRLAAPSASRLHYRSAYLVPAP
jgi:hypothetical protein